MPSFAIRAAIGLRRNSWDMGASALACRLAARGSRAQSGNGREAVERVGGGRHDLAGRTERDADQAGPGHDRALGAAGRHPVDGAHAGQRLDDVQHAVRVEGEPLRPAEGVVDAPRAGPTRRSGARRRAWPAWVP